MAKKKRHKVKRTVAAKSKRYSCKVIQRTLRDVRCSLLSSAESDDYLRGLLDACNTSIEAFNEC